MCMLTLMIMRDTLRETETDWIENLVPGCYLKEFGIFAFAATAGGNVLAIELESSFVRFLQKLSRDEYDEVEHYMDAHAAWNA